MDVSVTLIHRMLHAGNMFLW